MHPVVGDKQDRTIQQFVVSFDEAYAEGTLHRVSRGAMIDAQLDGFADYEPDVVRRELTDNSLSFPGVPIWRTLSINWSFRRCKKGKLLSSNA